MTDKLPPNLLALFAPRPPLRYLQHADYPQEERRTPHISGVATFLPALKEYDDDYAPTESWLQKRDRRKAEKKEAAQKLVTEGVTDYKPSEDAQIRGDAFKTLFVSRLSYDTESKDLEREFGRFGPIERIRIVTNTHASENDAKKKKNRGYAFIVYEREKDMKAAYKETDGIRIKDRRVLVDVERGRTVSGWRPRRFGGGLGGRGYTRAMPSRPTGAGGFNGAPTGPGGFRGGFRGGFGGQRGGGFRGGPRGGFGDRGGYGGGRGGIGYQSNGVGAGGAPDGAPAGPRGGRGGGYGGGGGRPYGPSGGYDNAGSGGGGYGRRPYEDRDRGATGSNMEPVRPRDRGGYRDRDRDRDRDKDRDRDRDRDRERDRPREGGYDDRGHSRKREYEGDNYGDQRAKRRY